ncbi:MAG: hypothetical protein DME19_13685 [Verrucomicrobia bacterium]|nr:MAG: hypothetical protein DME19_13685 [Verrucomicrobiota bacterium]
MPAARNAACTPRNISAVTAAPTGLVSPNVDGQRIPISNKGNKEVNPAHKAMDRSGGKRRAPFSPTSGSRNALQKPRPDG